MATRSLELYERDFYAWTRSQATALRRLAQARPNEPLDFAHLIEEVQDLGKSERDAVRRQVRTIIEHLLKLEHSAAHEPRAGWIISITDARIALQDKLSPSLGRDLVANLDRLYAQARQQALVALRVHGEVEAAGALPGQRAYALEHVLSDDGFPVRDAASTR